MKLKTILCESTKTDFYDIYVLQSCPYQNKETESLLEDRIDRILPILIRQAHNYIVQTAEKNSPPNITS